MDLPEAGDTGIRDVVTPDTVTPDTVTVGADQLQALLAAGSAVTLLDVRWALGDPHGHRHYLDGHLPGAAFVDLDRELSAPASAAAGRHPLPEPAQLQAAARRWGVRRNVPVVAYDDSGNLAAARAWWLLRWGGHPRVHLLDGGLGAWRAAGLPVVPGATTPPPGDVVLGGGGMPVVDAEGAAVAARTGVVLDARAAERYRGESEPIDPRAGHLPGARSAPTTDNLGPDGRFLPVAALRARFAGLHALLRPRLDVDPEPDPDTDPDTGPDPGTGPGTDIGRAPSSGPAGTGGAAPVAVYCGSGVTAAHEIAALMLAGVSGAALYAGSWSQWSADPSRPVATGPDPG